MRRQTGSLTFGMALLFCGAQGALAQSAAPPPPTVETAVVQLAAVAPQNTFVGSVVPVQQVDLVARVEGFLSGVSVTEGSVIQAGTVVFQIEKDAYQAALDGAQANLQAATAAQAGAAANLTVAETTLTRQQELLRTKAVSQSVVDDATAARDAAAAAVQQAAAQVLQAQAQVKLAQLNLSYTDIGSPITGRIGKTRVTAGNLVSASSGILATVIQTDPIRVAFSISDRDYLRVIKGTANDDASLAASAAAYQPSLVLADGSDYPLPGKIAFIDNAVDTSTGTIAVYAEFPNPKFELVPGQFVSVIVRAAAETKLPVIPAAAVLQDKDGAYVFILGDGNIAKMRRITLGVRVGENWAVSAGLSGGEILIVSGVQKIRADSPVDPRPLKAGD